MADDFSDRDIVFWAEPQAGLPRRRARGERVNDAVNWPHLIEEVEDLGRAELYTSESLLRQTMLHLLKLHAGADLPAARWRAEIVGFLADAVARFTPSMRQRIDLAALHARARQQAAVALSGDLAAPCACPWTLDGLLADPCNIQSLRAKLAPA